MLDKDHPEAPQGKKLLSARMLALQGFGWEVFSITQAVSVAGLACVRGWAGLRSREGGFWLGLGSLTRALQDAR